MIDLAINDESFSIPESYDELPFIDYVAIYQNVEGDKDHAITDKVNTIATILKKDKDYIMGLPVEAVNLIFDKIDWLFQEQAIKPSDSITIDGTRYTVTDAPEKMSLRQYIDAESESKNSDPNAYCRLMAIIVQGQDYDAKKTDELAEKIKKEPSANVIPLVAYYVKKKALSNEITRLYSVVEEMEDFILTHIESSTSETNGGTC